MSGRSRLTLLGPSGYRRDRCSTGLRLGGCGSCGEGSVKTEHQGDQGLCSHTASSAARQPGLHATEAPVRGVLPRQALVTCNSGEVPGLASLVHLLCNKEAKDFMNTGSKCIDEHRHSVFHSLGNENLCLWPPRVGAGIYLKEWN